MQIALGHPRRTAAFIPDSQLPESLPQVVRRAKRLVDQYPDDPRGHRLYALALADKLDFVGADHELRIANDQADVWPVVGKPITLMHVFANTASPGNELRSFPYLQHLDSARGGNAVLASMDELVAAHPDDSDYRFARAFVYSQMKQYAHAIDAVDEALAIDPKSVRALRFRGIVLTNERKFGEAAETFTEAIDIAPEDADLRTQRGMAYDGLADYDKAIADYDKALSLEGLERSRFAEQLKQEAEESRDRKKLKSQ